MLVELETYPSFYYLNGNLGPPVVVKPVHRPPAALACLGDSDATPRSAALSSPNRTALAYCRMAFHCLKKSTQTLDLQTAPHRSSTDNCSPDARNISHSPAGFFCARRSFLWDDHLWLLFCLTILASTPRFFTRTRFRPGWVPSSCHPLLLQLH